MTELNILITGAAGDIARSISRILESKGVTNLYGIDLNGDFPSSLYYKKFEISYRVDESEYINFIERFISDNSIDLIVPTSEAEIRYFNEKRINQICNATLIMASNNIMDVGFDKLKTMDYLEQLGIDTPWTIDAGKGAPNEYPCIYKSKSSSGSKEVIIVNSIEDHPFEKNFNYVYQELLVPLEEEYTCGIYKTKTNQFSYIVFKRKLINGRTGSGQVICNEKINEFLDKFCEKVNFQGSINIQFILTTTGPKIFEINPRFSSTVLFRDLLGFKDLWWSIQENLNMPVDLNNFKLEDINGKKIYRVDQEIVY